MADKDEFIHERTYSSFKSFFYMKAIIPWHHPTNRQGCYIVENIPVRHTTIKQHILQKCLKLNLREFKREIVALLSAIDCKNCDSHEAVTSPGNVIKGQIDITREILPRNKYRLSGKPH